MVLERLMEQRIGRHLDMVLTVDPEKAAAAQTEVDFDAVARDVSNALGIDITVE